MSTAMGASVTSGLMFYALPDTKILPIEYGKNGKVEFIRLNLLELPQELGVDLAASTQEYWHPNPRGKPSATPDWIVNLCTDPDTYGQSMSWLDDTYGDTVPIFNHPRGLQQTTRDAQAARLDGIANLTVPRTVRFTFETVADLQRVFDQNGFAFPVIVRPNEEQRGRGMVRIDSAADWEKLLYSRWFRRPHLMIQFIDTQTAEGGYLKTRVVFVGGKPFLRHVKAGPEWKVHNNPGQSFMGFPEREIDMIDRLEGDTSFMQICRDIGARVPLDFFGADFGVNLDAGQIVLFEANASMSVFFPRRSGLTKDEEKRRERLQETPAKALAKLIADPSRWCNGKATV